MRFAALGCACAVVIALALPAPAGSVAVGDASAGVALLGAAPSLPQGARITGSLAAGTRMHVTITLQPRDPLALQNFATAVSTPGSPEFRHYITPAEFAQRFGPTPATVHAVESSLRAHGLMPGRSSANALAIPVNANAGSLEDAFSVSLAHVRLQSGAGAVVNQQAPSLDAAVAPHIQALLGLDTLTVAKPLLVRAHAATQTPRSRPHVVTGGPQPCPAASATASTMGGLTADQVAGAYGLSGLYESGGSGGSADEGAGQSIAVLELEPYDPNDIAAYQQCYGTSAPLANIPVDGGAGSGPGTGEAALDIENVIGLAPRANVVVYEGPNSGSGPYDTFNAIISQHTTQVVTASWGQCEFVNGFSQTAAENTLFQEAAAQGQSILSASGDEGAEDCYPLQPTAQVDDPASQPYVTGIGGTRVNSVGPRPSESVWNDGATVGASGGGISTFWKMPAYQSGTPASLHVIGQGSTGATCGAPAGFCREVPDVSADASPATGYLIYFNGSKTAGGVPPPPSGWQVVGGTSAAAPVWAALIALGNASAACHGVAIGFANPALYHAASIGYKANFNDVTTGNNDMTGGNGGQFAARPGYDMATGLGSPNGASLAPALCADAITLINPGPQRATPGSAVRLQIKAFDTHGASVRYHAGGLPRGLSINAVSGKITGRPRRIGKSKVTVTVSDATGTTAATSFKWTIEGSPTLSQASLTGVGAARPTLSFTLAAGRGAPKLRAVVVALPAGLRFTQSGATVTVTGFGGRHVSDSVALQRGSLVIRLRNAATHAHVTVTYPSIRADSGLAAQVARRHASPLTVSVRATDALNLTTQLRARVTPSQ